MFRSLVDKYPDCFVRYVAVYEGEFFSHYECHGDLGRSVTKGIEKNFDLQRARKVVGNRPKLIVAYLNGEL